MHYLTFLPSFCKHSSHGQTHIGEAACPRSCWLLPGSRHSWQQALRTCSCIIFHFIWPKVISNAFCGFTGRRKGAYHCWFCPGLFPCGKYWHCFRDSTCPGSWWEWLSEPELLGDPAPCTPVCWQYLGNTFLTCSLEKHISSRQSTKTLSAIPLRKLLGGNFLGSLLVCWYSTQIYFAIPTNIQGINPTDTTLFSVKI